MTLHHPFPSVATPNFQYLPRSLLTSHSPVAAPCPQGLHPLDLGVLGSASGPHPHSPCTPQTTFPATSSNSDLFCSCMCFHLVVQKHLDKIIQLLPLLPIQPARTDPTTSSPNSASHSPLPGPWDTHLPTSPPHSSNPPPHTPTHSTKLTWPRITPRLQYPPLHAMLTALAEPHHCVSQIGESPGLPASRLSLASGSLTSMPPPN